MKIPRSRRNTKSAMDEKIEYRAAKIRQDDYAESPRDWDNLGTMVCWHRRYSLGDEQPDCTPGEWAEALAMEADDTVERRLEHWRDGKGWSELENRLGEGAPGAVEEKCAEVVEKALAQHVLRLPLYLYDHSGLSISTSRFTCPWDSGQVGWIYVTHERLKAEFCVSRIAKRHKEEARTILDAEVKTYDDYLRGNVWSVELFCAPEGWFGGEIWRTADGESRRKMTIDLGKSVDSCSGFFGTGLEETGILDNFPPEYENALRKAWEERFDTRT